MNGSQPAPATSDHEGVRSPFLPRRARSLFSPAKARPGASSDYDAIIIGAGHNGLIAAALFAQAGAHVLVLEGREKVGGCTDTSTPWPEHPDFHVSTYSYVAGLMPRRIIAALRLYDHGLRIYPLGPYSVPLPDGRCLVLPDDARACRDNIAPFSPRDAEAWVRYEEWLGRLAEVIWPLFLQVPPKLGSSAPSDLLDLAKVAWRLRRLDVRGVADLTRLFTASAAELLDHWFESDAVKAAPAVTSAIGSWAGPYASGTAYVLLHLSMGDPGDGHVGGWGFVRGGMGGLAAACRRAAELAGAEIRTGERVERILVQGERAAGVVTASGAQVRAPIVVSTVHPRTTALKLIGRELLPDEYVADIERFKSRGGAVKINLALARLPQLVGVDERPDDRGVCSYHRGSIELGPSPRYVQNAFDQAVSGQPATHPIADATFPSASDDSLMPPGLHCMSIFAQWVPWQWVDEPHRAQVEAFADRVIAHYAQTLPGLADAILARQVIGPYDLETELGLVGGNVYGGELSVDQMFHMRPVPGYAGYRTPINGVYNASAGAHGGGGVSGIPGWQAFQQAMRDRKRRHT